MKPPVPGQRQKNAVGDRAEESEISMVNNAKRINGHLNNDLNMSGIVDMKIRL